MLWKRCAAGVLLGVATVAWGQSVGFTPRVDADQIPSYELVAIHKVQGAGAAPGINDIPYGFAAKSQTLRSLIGEAYGFSLGIVPDFQLVGAPSWAKTQLFDIQGKVDAANVEKMKKLEKAETMMATVRELATRTPSYRMLMLQRLLEDRFKLKVHYEQHVMPLYEMTVAKGGVLMKASHPKDPEDGSMQMDNGKLVGSNVPISFIPVMFAMELERPVEDRTDASGSYDFELHWSRMGDDADKGTADASPSLFTAVQEQMGLKLRASKGPVWVIVVDHAEMPSEN